MAVTSRSLPASTLPADAVASGTRRYAAFAWVTLGFNLLVILWGAFVRATGSGAGCGSHWPLCNGEIIPRSPAIETLIELGHRTTSGIALLLVAILFIGAWRRFPRGHAARRAATCSMLFILTEALIGAGLVLLELVAHNASLARGFWVAGHLVNTFLLIGALALTAQWASVPPPAGRTAAARLGVFWVALGALVIQGISGAITALGDTLFPAASLSEAEIQNFSDTAHVFVRLRIWHPTLALVVGLAVLSAAVYAVATSRARPVRTLAAGLMGLYLVQLGVGLANVWLLAPIALQLVHLLLSDLIWIFLVLLAANAYTSQGVRREASG